MKKLLFLFGIILCLVGCQKSPTVDVVGYGVVEYATEYDEYFVTINDHVLVVDKVLSGRGTKSSLTYDVPVAGKELVCYRLSGKDTLYFARKDIDLNVIQEFYFSAFEENMANIIIAAWITFVFIVIILMLREFFS